MHDTVISTVQLLMNAHDVYPVFSPGLFVVRHRINAVVGIQFDLVDVPSNRFVWNLFIHVLVSS